MGLIFREGLSFILPVAVLIGLLISGFSPTYAGVLAIFAVVVVSWLTPVRMGPRAVLEALALGSRNMVVTAVLLCAIGLIVNVIATAGIGNTFSLMITEWAGGNLLLALLLVALASLVLGMGLPVTASYIVLATLSAPALFNLMADTALVQGLSGASLNDDLRAVLFLVAPDLAAQSGPLSEQQAATLVAALPMEILATLRPMVLEAAQLSMLLLAAHLIIFWLSQDSNVTPPVCLCTFTAAAIAGSSPMATGLTSWKLAKALYLIPILFAYTPLVTGTLAEAAEVFVFALGGLYAFSAFMQGWSGGLLGPMRRLLVGLCALGLLWPAGTWMHLGVLAALLLVLLSNRGWLAGFRRAGGGRG
jgi:TRAP-type uncharacterized transport system fused permease subunit